MSFSSPFLSCHSALLHVGDSLLHGKVRCLLHLPTQAWSSPYRP